MGYNVWDVDIWKPTRPVPETIHNLTEDALVLSCVIKRLREKFKDEPEAFITRTSSMYYPTTVNGIPYSMQKNVNSLFLSIDSSLISEFILEEDRVLADAIRQYYNYKLMIITLRNEPLSLFRKNLNVFLTSNHYDQSQAWYDYTDNELRMAYKLPYFYEYDQQLETKIFDGSYKEIIDTAVDKRHGETVRLSYLGKLNANQKSKGTFEYWFKNADGHRFQLRIDKTNVLLPIWEKHIIDHEIVTTAFTKIKRDQLEFYSVISWKLD